MNKTILEKAYIIVPIFPGDDHTLKLDEIRALTKSAGAEICGEILYQVREITPSTFIGSGKLEEISYEVDSLDVNVVIFDGELTPSQTINISEALNGVKVIDRTTLILDIFALNAFSSEGKLQIELAQLKYIYPRLKGKGQALSRLGGGIGTRGPGETQLETDRRHIRTRIDYLENKLAELETRRQVQAFRRDKNECKTVALVGYTNAGKSTLLNALTGADVYVQDKLFATLDPTIRKLKLDDFEVLLVDTVGFVRNIPHDIIEAFKSTLEFAVNADLILNVCDGSGNWQNELSTTIDTLSQFENVPKTVTVINKCDKIEDFSGFPQNAVFISAKEGRGIDTLLNRINEEFSQYYTKIEFNIPYSLYGEFTKMLKLVEKHAVEYLDDGIKISATIRKIHLKKFEKFFR